MKIDGETISYGPKSIYFPAESPFVIRHHHNWRHRAFTAMDRMDPEHLFFTCPMSLSEEAVKSIRALLPSVIQRVMRIAGPSASEKAYCLNLDWFEY